MRKVDIGNCNSEKTTPDGRWQIIGILYDKPVFIEYF